MNTTDSIEFDGKKATVYQNFGHPTLWIKQFPVSQHTNYQAIVEIGGFEISSATPVTVVRNLSTGGEITQSDDGRFYSDQLNRVEIGLRWNKPDLEQTVTVNKTEIIETTSTDLVWKKHRDISEVYEKTVDAVVRVMQSRSDGVAIGCGVVITAQPVRVVTGMSLISLTESEMPLVQITVNTSDGLQSKLYQTKLLGYSDFMDLAILELLDETVTALTTIKMASSCNTGDLVAFVSHAFAVLSTGGYAFGAETISQGIIRGIKVKYGAYPIDYISSDFDTATGDRYGALLNSSGELLGLYHGKEQNTLYPLVSLGGKILKAPAGSVHGSIPFDLINQVSSYIIQQAAISKSNRSADGSADGSDNIVIYPESYLGVETLPIGLYIFNFLRDNNSGKHWNDDGQSDVIGIMVNQIILGSPADAAGLRLFDLLTHISTDGGTTYRELGSLNHQMSLSKEILLSDPGDQICLKYRKYMEYHLIEHQVKITTVLRSNVVSAISY